MVTKAYAQRERRLQESLNNTLSQLDRSLNYGMDAVNKNADGAQQQAYINYMMGKKDMPQTLSALGITGGMSESTAASLQNSYGNSRNKIDYGRNEELASVRAAYDANKTEALNAYNKQLDDFDMNKLAYEIDYSKQLAAQQQAAAKAASKSYTPNNAPSATSLQQSDNSEWDFIDTNNVLSLGYGPINRNTLQQLLDNGEVEIDEKTSNGNIVFKKRGFW